MVNTRQAQGEGSMTGNEEQMDKLINKVCARFISQLESKLDARMDKLDSKLSEVCNTLTNINKTVSENKKAVTELQEKVDFLEQDLKRKSLRFCGISELPRENLHQLISSFINDQMKISCEDRDIDYAFRVGQETNGKPRTIIINFTTISKRNEVYFAKKMLKGTPYALFEDLTAKRYELLSLAKKKYGNKAWSFGGSVFYWSSNENRKVKVKSKSDM